MSLILPRRFKSQPQYAAPIDDQGLGKGVKILFNPPAGYVDLVTGRSWARNGNAQIVATTHGRALSFDGANSSLNITDYPELGGIGTFFAYFARVGPSDPFGHDYLGSISPTNKHYLVSAAGKIWSGTPYSSNEAISGWFSSTNRSLVCSEANGPADVKAYVDGRDSGLTWGSSGSVTWGSGNKNLEIGGAADSTNWDANCDAIIIGWTSEIWGAREAKAFHDSKGLALFHAEPRRIWVAAASTGSYTLPADSGSFSVTGTDASLEFNRKLTADSGSFAISGTAATFTKGYQLSADSGAFAVTGTAATFRKGIRLAADPGSFAVTGTDAALKSGRVVQADSGSFSVTGTAASLEFHRVLSTDSGSVTVTGTAASLEFHRVLSAESGSIQTTGTDAALTRETPGNYSLTAEFGSFAATGTDAALKVNRSMSADSGSFAFTGSAASLRYAKLVIAEAGQFAITGNAATLTRTGGPEAITSTVERTAVFQHTKNVNVRFN